MNLFHVRKTLFGLLLFGNLFFSVCTISSAQEPGKSSTEPQSTEPSKVDLALASPQVVSRSLQLVPGNAPVIEELELLEYQVEQVKQIQYDLQRALGEAAKTTAKMQGQEKKAAFEEIYKEVDGKLKSALLPDQFRRLKQIAIQSFGISNSTGEVDVANLVSNSAIQRQLGLSNEKMKQVRARMLEEAKRMAAELERLRMEARNNVLEVLSDEERQQLDEMIGKPFDFKGFSPGRRGRFSNKEDH